MSTAIISQKDLQPAPSLEDLLVAGQEIKPEHFTINNPEKAAWAARRIKAAQDRIEERKDLAKSYKAQIDAWFRKSIQEDEESIDFLKQILRPYVDQEISVQRKSKTLRLPGISVQLRKKPDRIDVVENETAISFCEANHPDAVIIKKEISKSYLKQLLAKGEIIPGCDLMLGEEEIYIKEE